MARRCQSEVFLAKQELRMTLSEPADTSLETPAVSEAFHVLQCHGEDAVIQQVNSLERRLFSKAFALTGDCCAKW